VTPKPELLLDDATRWERRGELAEGGMGVVTIVHDRWLDRDIAVKVPSSEQDAARLLFEARVTASLDHPGIVSVFDAGRSPTGEPWFAMRLVRGRSLAEAFADSQAAAGPVTSKLRHVLAAAEAVGYAHAHGVIHRDLKPANIMVGPFGETQVIDWGLAIAAGVESPDPGRAGTAAAMSPEQARREPLDARCDVYALGMILYEAVCRRPAFPTSMSRDAILVALCEDRVPVLPSSEIAIPPELRAIIGCATHPSRERRYPDAKALADDLAHYLEGRRVSVHTYSARELFTRLLKLWRVPILLGLVASVVVVATLVFAFARVADERDVSEQTLGRTLVDKARLALHEDDRGAAEVLARAALLRGDFPEARGVLLASPRARPIRTPLPMDGCKAVDVVWPGVGGVAAGASRAGGSPLVLCHDASGIAVRQGTKPLWKRALVARAAVFIAQGELVLVQHDGSRLERLETKTGASRGEIQAPCAFSRLMPTPDLRQGHIQHHECSVLVGPTSEVALPVSGCLDGVLRISNVSADGQRWVGACGDGSLIVGPVGGEVGARVGGEGVSEPSNLRRIETRLPVSPARPLATALAVVDDLSVLVGDSDGGLSLIDLEHPEKRRRLVLHPALLRDIHVSPDRRRALVRFEDGPIYVVDLSSWASLGRLPPRTGVGYHTAGFTPDGDVFASSSGRLERWDFGAVPVRVLTFVEGITDLALATDGKTLAVGHGASLSFVDVATRSVSSVDTWQPELVRTLAFAPEGQRGARPPLYVGTLGVEGLHRIDASGAMTTAPLGRFARKVVALEGETVMLSDFGRRLLVMGSGPFVAGPPLVCEDHHTSPDGRHLAVLDVDQQVWVASDWSVGEPMQRVATAVGARKVARFDGAQVFALDRDGVSEFEVGAEGVPVVRYQGDGSELGSLAVSPTIIAAGSRNGSVHVWRRGQAEPIAVVRDHERRVDELAISTDGRWLMAGDWNGRVLFIDTELVGATAEEATAASEAWGLTLEDLVRSR
jgi:WD40 repeat protein